MDTSVLNGAVDLDTDITVVAAAQHYGYRLDNHAATNMYYEQ